MYCQYFIIYLNIYYLFSILFFSENDNKCEASEEPKRLSSPTSSETSSISSRLSSPESISSNSSTHVHYKKRVSRTFAESQNNITS